MKIDRGESLEPERLGGYADESRLASVPKAAHQRLLGPTLQAQRIEGTACVRFLGQSLDPSNLATWALGLWVVSADGNTSYGTLLPFGFGTKCFRTDALRPYMVGPLPMTVVDAPHRSRVLLELGLRVAKHGLT